MIKKNDNAQFRGNACLKHNDRHCDRKISNVIEKIDSIRNLEEYFQDKHGEKWTLTDVESRERFTNFTESQIKCAAGINVHGERIKLIDKGNEHAVFPTCNALEAWEHVMLSDKMKDKRYELAKKIEKSFNEVAKKVKASTYEKNVVNEMTKEIKKYFNKENNFWTNQQIIGLREVFRGFAVKS